MHRARSLTAGERWDLGLLLALFSVTFLCLTVVWRQGAFTRLWAFAFVSEAPVVRSVEGAMEEGGAAAAMEAGVEEVEEVVEEEEPVITITPVPGSIAGRAEAAAPVKAAVQTKPVAKAVEDVKYYNGKKYRYSRTIRMRVTAYAPDPRCCWPYPGTTTASGKSVKTNGGKLVAADTRILPFGTLVSVPGYNGGRAVPVLDRGGAIKGHRLDVLLPTFDVAKAWGARYENVKVYVPVN